MSEVKHATKQPAAVHKWFGKRPGLFINNIRFYILLTTGLISFLVAAILRTEISSNTLYLIRVQQIYGFLALFFWYIALLATPLSSIFGKEGAMRHYLFSRRALGVSAAYLATLHMLLGVFGQLGGINNLFLLPWRFQQALLFGATALVVLLLMAVTSFDSVIRWMTFPRWKWLHRFTYIAAILVFLHIWIIGTHTAYPWVRWTFFWALTLLLGLESWRMALQLKKRIKGFGRVALIILFVTFFTWSVVVITWLPTLFDGYHETHTDVGGH